jgi:cytoskeletal protein RodZ
VSAKADEIIQSHSGEKPMKHSMLMSLSLAAVSLGAIAALSALDHQSATAQAQQPQQEQLQEQPQAQPKVGCNEANQSAEQTI